MTDNETLGRRDEETKETEDTISASSRPGVPVSPILAAVVALGGIADAVYLTIHHLTAEPVPCGETFDCGAVLTSPYAEIGGIPLAAFGAAAYFAAFSLALLAAFGNRLMWKIFTVQITLMTFFTLYLIYLQAFVIKAYCQFCLISAAITFTLLIIVVISKFRK